VDFIDELLAVIRSLNEQEVEYVLIGGAALNVHGLIRTTEDLDLFIAPTADNIARTRRALHAVWNDPDIELITTEDLLGEYPAVRYGPPSGAIYLDILTRLGDLASFDDLQSEIVELNGVPVCVATPRTLFRLKRDTVRPIDKADAEALRQAFDLGDDDVD
jgi:hypothetical protein